MGDEKNTELNEEQVAENIQDWNKDELDIEKLLQENKSLQVELKKYQEIASNSQSQYLNLKFDFDWFIRRVEREKQEWWVKALIDTFSIFLPFIENLRKSIEDVPSEIEKSNWVKWVALLYVNLIKRLEEIWIYEIKCLWVEPDPEQHEPISVQPVEDENLKWKITQECERWFYYQKWDQKIVINPSKVIVWN